MGLFGPPNVNKLKANKDVSGWIKALGYEKDNNVRGNAAEALGEIGDPRAVEPLITALGDSITGVREKVAKALGLIGDSRAVEPLIAVLGELSQRYVVRQYAAKALGKIGDSRAVEPLIATLGDSNYLIRESAIEALGQIGDSRAVEPLIAALGDNDAYVRKQSVDALSKIGWQPDQDKNGAIYWIVKRKWDKCVEIGESAVEPLIAALGDKSSDVRQSAADALGQIRDNRAVMPLISALGDNSYDVCQSAANALGEIGDFRAVEPLIAALRKKSKYDLSQMAAAAALNGNTLLFEKLQDKSFLIRRSAADALGKIGDHRAVEPLIAALGDNDENVRKKAMDALDKMNWNPAQDKNGAIYWIGKGEWDKCVEIGESAIEPLTAALNDQQIHVRALAFRALRKLRWEPDERTDMTRYREAKAIWEKAEQKKQSALKAAQNWWEGRPFPKTASGDEYICDVCNGEILEKENTSLLGSWMRCQRCTENLFERWEQGKD